MRCFCAAVESRARNADSEGQGIRREGEKSTCWRTRRCMGDVLAHTQYTHTCKHPGKSLRPARSARAATPISTARSTAPNRTARSSLAASSFPSLSETILDGWPRKARLPPPCSRLSPCPTPYIVALRSPHLPSHALPASSSLLITHTHTC